MKDYMITIPTYKRAGTLLRKNNTLDYFDEKLLKKTKIVIRNFEVYDYLPVLKKYKGLTAYCIKDDTDGIVETRDKIFDLATDYEKLIVIDDDIRFALRPNLDGTYRKQTQENFSTMIEKMLYYCGFNYPIVGITARQFSNTKTNETDENKRIIQVWTFHIPTIKKVGIRYSDAGTLWMTDYYITLTMLTLGYKNLVLNRYTKDDDVQMPGGCAETRTAKDHSNSARILCRLFPDLLTPTIKNTGAWKERRLNVRVSWKKAFNKKLYEERSKK